MCASGKQVLTGILGGMGGGICQVSVMGPCTFLVTAQVRSSSLSFCFYSLVLEACDYRGDDSAVLWEMETFNTHYYEKVTGGPGKSVLSIASETWNSKGLKGFYPGGTAIAFRQATNWASRQGAKSTMCAFLSAKAMRTEMHVHPNAGFTDAVRVQIKVDLNDHQHIIWMV